MEIHKISKSFLLHYGNKYKFEISCLITDRRIIILNFRKNQKKSKPKNTGSSTGLEAMSNLSMVID